MTGLPALKQATEIDRCPTCISAKMTKTARNLDAPLNATMCNQHLSIDFGFIVQKSKDEKRMNSLAGRHGETCYVLITDHFSGKLYGHCQASKGPPLDWLKKWLAANRPKDCPPTSLFVRMDGGGELGKCRDVTDLFRDFGYAVQVTGPDASSMNGMGERPHRSIAEGLARTAFHSMKKMTRY
jgi:hypothetical protein